VHAATALIADTATEGGSGFSATVTIRDGKHGENRAFLQSVCTELETSVFGLIGEAAAWPGRIPNPS
jgi:hypothetical protein